LETQFTYRVPTETIIPVSTTPLKFGFGATEELGYELRRLGLRRVIIVSDPQVVKTGLLSKVEALIAGEKIDAQHYYDVHVEPTDISFKQASQFQNAPNLFIEKRSGH